MKKILARVALGLGALIALVVVGGSVFVFGFRPRVRAAKDLKAPSTPETIARGAYLANQVAACPACHSDSLPFQGASLPEGRRWVGRNLARDMEQLGATGKALGAVTAHNLTSSREHGIGGWTDGELVRAIRDGVAKDGRALFPMMPAQDYGAGFSDDDALAIVAYLRSLPAAEEGPPPSKLGFLGGVVARVVVQPATDQPALSTSTPDYGKRLLRAGLCAHCHSSGEGGGDEPDFTGGGEDSEVRAPNITSDPVEGIGSYSEEDIVRALEGTKRSGEPIRQMPSYLYKDLSRDDKVAIARAVKAIPPRKRGH